MQLKKKCFQPTVDWIHRRGPNGRANLASSTLHREQAGPMTFSLWLWGGWVPETQEVRDTRLPASGHMSSFFLFSHTRIPFQCLPGLLQTQFVPRVNVTKSQGWRLEDQRTRWTSPGHRWALKSPGWPPAKQERAGITGVCDLTGEEACFWSVSIYYFEPQMGAEFAKKGLHKN